MASSDNTPQTEKPDFQPLELMGYFWLVLGLIVLAATFFVRGNQYVPLIRGVVTNLVAGAVITGVGLFAVLKGRADRRRG